MEPIDAAKLDRLRADIGAEQLAQLMAAFIEDAASLLEEISGAITDGDAPQLMRSAHSLMSTGALIGADALAAACAELEALGRDGEASKAGPAAERAAEAFEAAREALRRLGASGAT